MNALIISAVLGVVMMFSGILLKQKSSIRTVAVAGILLLLVMSILDLNGIALFTIDTREMIVFDRFALVFNTMIFAVVLLYLLVSAPDMEKVGVNYAEYFALIFFILCGVTLVTSFKSLLILFLGIEIISIPLYILTGSDKRNLKSNEASLKYFLLGSFSTGLMLMGIALLYGARATFSTVTVALVTPQNILLLTAGMSLLLFSMAFKVSAAPFHFWTPDVYDGAPTVFTSFMATVVKAAAFFAFARLFENAFGNLHAQWQTLIVIIIAATLLIGNITAVFQQSVKRMLAYSSIAQAGFMLFALFALNNLAKEGLVLYSAAYSLASIGIFAILIKMKDYTIDGFNGLAKQQPLLAVTATVFLLSLTGIPLTAGFQAKFYMLLAAVQNGHHIWLVILAVLCAAISTYYYFRIIQAMFFKESGEAEALVEDVTPAFKILLVITAILIIGLGMLPYLLTDWLYF